MVFPQDPVAAAKVIADFAKGNDKLVVKGGAYAGKALDADGVKALASIPSKEVLLSQLLGLMQSPVSRIARVLAAIAEKREAPAEAAGRARRGLTNGISQPSSELEHSNGIR